MSEFKLPERCNDCPMQCNMSANLERLIVRQSLSVAAESLVGENGEKLDEYIKNTVGDEDEAKVMASLFRQSAASNLNKIDEDEAALRHEMKAVADSCDGVIKIRATKAGRQYILTLCGSARVNIINSELPLHAPTHLRVTNAE